MTFNELTIEIVDILIGIGYIVQYWFWVHFRHEYLCSSVHSSKSNEKLKQPYSSLTIIRVRLDSRYHMIQAISTSTLMAYYRKY